MGLWPGRERRIGARQLAPSLLVALPSPVGGGTGRPAEHPNVWGGCSAVHCSWRVLPAKWICSTRQGPPCTGLAGRGNPGQAGREGRREAVRCSAKNTGREVKIYNFSF